MFYPPIDFLNWGQPNAYFNYLQYEPILAQFRILEALKFQAFDSEKFVYKPIKGPEILREKSITQFT